MAGDRAWGDFKVNFHVLQHNTTTVVHDFELCKQTVLSVNIQMPSKPELNHPKKYLLLFIYTCYSYCNLRNYNFSFVDVGKIDLKVRVYKK